MRKISIRKIAVFAIYILFIILLVIGIVKILFLGKKTINVEVVDKIDNYNYTLNSNATDYYKGLFNELSNLLKNDDFDEKSYTELVSKLFITDVYTLDNKLNKNDIGGTEYVYSNFKDDFNMIAQSTIYKNIKNNMYNDRVQDLPIVKEVIINSIDNDDFEYEKNVFENAYYVDVSVNYESDLGYPTNISLVIIKNNDKLEVAKMEAK